MTAPRLHADSALLPLVVELRRHTKELREEVAYVHRVAAGVLAQALELAAERHAAAGILERALEFVEERHAVLRDSHG